MKVRELGEIIEVSKTKISCDGGGGSTGHPNVYLTLGNDNRVSCPYCGRQFVLADTFVRGED